MESFVAFSIVPWWFGSVWLDWLAAARRAYLTQLTEVKFHFWNVIQHRPHHPPPPLIAFSRSINLLLLLWRLWLLRHRTNLVALIKDQSGRTPRMV